MSRRYRFTAILAVALLVAMMCTACGKAKYADSQYLGTWKATSAQYSGEKWEVADILGGDFTVELKEDGTCVIDLAGQGGEGNWEESDSGVILSDDSDTTMELTADGDQLTYDVDEVEFILELQEEEQ